MVGALMGLPNMEQTRQDLFDAWRAWDHAPSNRDRVHDLELAYGNHAAHFGMQGLHFRDVCIAWRRAKMTREQAVTATENGATHQPARSSSSSI